MTTVQHLECGWFGELDGGVCPSCGAAFPTYDDDLIEVPRDETEFDRHPKSRKGKKRFIVEYLRVITFLGSPPDGVWRTWGRHKTASGADTAVASLSKKYSGKFEFRARADS